MQIHWFDQLSSTQTYLLEALKEKKLKAPVAVVTDVQLQGKGSRGNAWQGIKGNLFFSFALSREALPEDLKLESSSIYFSYLLKEVLTEAGSELWLKWPNDFYLDDKKIGGAITNMQGNLLICGIGMNLLEAPEPFGTLDLGIDRKEILEKFFKKLESRVSWKQIFRNYEVEFYKSRSYFTHLDETRVSLEDAILQSDGSIKCNGQRIFSLR